MPKESFKLKLNRFKKGDKMDFIEFPKIPRFSREIIISEKIDGTNGVIYIGEDMDILVGSRTRWITPENDNHGFARWVLEHREELLKLGPGRHFGEWWGSGIQRGYGLTKGEKRFSLFNVSRWADPNVRPACCSVVPEIVRGLMDTDLVQWAIDKLASEGSLASPGFMHPEGVVIFHTASGYLFKKTILKDEVPKNRMEGRPTGRTADFGSADGGSMPPPPTNNGGHLCQS